MAEEMDRETKAYLARIRKTVEESNRLVEQVGLRIRETDRMLEQQGLTREQVMAMKFSDAQLEAVNDELKRRGLDPLEKWNMNDHEMPDEDPSIMGGASDSEVTGVSGAELENRQRKFGMMMKPFQI
jgi:hypothetical protein